MMGTNRMLSDSHLFVLVAFISWGNAVAQFSYSPLDGSTSNITHVPFRLDISHLKSTPSKIVISWQVSTGYAAQEYQVQHRRHSGQTWLSSADQNANQTEYSISGLQADSMFEVCILMNYTELAQTGIRSARECSVLVTIPYIRTDSIIALSVTLGYIVVTVLIGFCHWQVKKCQYEKKREELNSLRQQEGEELICKPDSKPHCSIEERTTSL